MSGFGPRTYLVGQILPALLANPKNFTEAYCIDEAIRLADLVEARMRYPTAEWAFVEQTATGPR